MKRTSEPSRRSIICIDPAMRKFYLLSFLLTFMFFINSCNDRGGMEVKLSRAETFITDNPDMALKVLDSLDVEELSTRRLRARYALLYSIALDKNYVDVKDDSIIAPAVRYYARHGSADEKLNSLYYYARVQYNAGDYNPAMVTLMEALSLLDSSSSLRTCALVHNLFALIYNRSYMFQDALEYMEKAHDFAVRCGDNELADLFLYRSAQLYNNLKRYDKAEELYVQVLGNRRIDEKIMAEVMCSYAHTLLLKDEPDYSSSVRWYEKALAITPAFHDANHWGAYAYALKMTGNENSSENLFSQLSAMSNDDRIKHIYDSWTQMALVADKNYEDAYAVLAAVLPYQDSVLRSQLQNSAAKAQRDYWIVQNDKTLKEKQLSGAVLSLTVLLMIFVVLILCIVYKKRMMTVQTEKELLYGMSETIRNQMDSLRTHMNESEEKLKSIRREYIMTYKSQFNTLGELCETYIKSADYKDSHKMVYDKVKSMVKQISGDESGQRSLEDMIDRSLDNIMKHSREDFPSYSEVDYRFVSYMIVGFDATTLCMILGLPSKDAVYMKKMRIKKKIQKCTSLYKDFYLEMLG